ncbi:MAG: aminoacyl-tRNA hydrolase [Deltaproteobacteria bacterium]|nr:aminoacyl-tRNA hydrolase [Deltaproteobacteria bacterium]
MPLAITPQITIPDADLRLRFGQARGPGGQNVNKVSTRVELRLRLAGCRALGDAVKQRLRQSNRRRLTAAGDLVVASDRFRAQARNREDAERKMIALIRAALRRPKPRRPTRVPAAERQRRLDAKRKRAEVKRARRTIDD